MFKSFDDFVKLACQTYDITYKEADNFIRQRLDYFCLTPRTIVCYINWAGLKNYSSRQIAEYLKVHHDTVCEDLLRLYQIWPHLFEFGPLVPRIQDMPLLPENFEERFDVEKF